MFKIIKIILCLIGIHNWKILKYSKYNIDESLYEQGHDRVCSICQKEQSLMQRKDGWCYWENYYHEADWIKRQEKIK